MRLGLLAILISSNIYATCKEPPVIVAAIDTGFGYNLTRSDPNLCSSGHKDFSNPELNSRIPYDYHGHGTNIVGTIEHYANSGHTNFCIVILKYYSGHGDLGNLTNTILAFKEATKLGAKYINYSSGGPEPSSMEKEAVEAFLNSGGTLTVSAGNEGLDLDKNTYYPANYDKRIINVGMLEKNGVQSKISNYGKAVTRWEIGRDVIAYGITMSGTSMSAAVAMGKILAQNKNKCDIGR